MLTLLLPCAAAAQQSIGDLYASDASVKGSVVLAGSGTSVLSGSSIQAGAQAATLKLDRGGSLLVCEGTKLSITSSQTGREMMFSLNSGNVEMNYPLGAEADTLLTPDLRLLLPGPGTVHVAVRVSPEGDTCVQSLPWNVAAIVVSETMGDATYQVKPDEAVQFRRGHLNEASRSSQNCGCPRSLPPATQVAKAAAPQPVTVPAPPVAIAGSVSAPPAPKPAGSTPAPPSPAEQHLAVEAPFIFRGSDPFPDMSATIAVLRLESTKLIQLEPIVLPPATSKKKSAAANPQPTETARKQSHGFFSKIGAFFAAVFR